MTTQSLPRAAATAPEADTDRSGVPWSTVLPLAVPIGLAAGFWTVALRTSLGSIERTSSPFASWARESILLMPFFALAVLTALTLARRRFGCDVSSFRQVSAVSLLVAGFGTVAGTGEMALSSAYDYHLQVRQLAMMDMMRGDCPATCRHSLVRATLGLQERSVLIGTLILLLTNVVLVTWVVALRGGRLRLDSPNTSRFASGLLGPLGSTRILLVSGLAGSAVIHAAVIPEHLAEWTAAGVFFVLLTAVELGLAAAVVAVPRQHLLQWACLAASTGPLMLWLGSRTLGMPFGPEPGVPEPVGLADVAACALEVVTAVAAIALLRSRTDAGGYPAGVHRARLVLVLVLAVTTLGLGGTSVRWVGFGLGDTASMSPTPSSASTGSPPGGSLNQG